MGRAGRQWWWAILASLTITAVGLSGVFLFPPTKSDDTWLRFAGFLALCLFGAMTLLVTSTGLLVATLMMRRRGDRR